jgi:hypothetical protein
VSIPVDLADLPGVLEGFDLGYLLTTADGRVKVVAVDCQAVDGLLLVAAPGRGSTANLATNPAVTLLFPPTEPPGFTLLVDGTAEVVGDVARVTPTSAVLHRPAGGPE